MDKKKCSSKYALVACMGKSVLDSETIVIWTASLFALKCRQHFRIIGSQLSVYEISQVGRREGSVHNGYGTQGARPLVSSSSASGLCSPAQVQGSVLGFGFSRFSAGPVL